MYRSALATLLILISILGLNAQSIEKDGISYYVINGGAWVLGSASGVTPEGELVIPDEIESDAKTYPVTEISGQAFRNESGITSLKLGKNIKVISSNAFYNCSNLEGELILPAGLTTIDMNAFSHCSKLSGELIIPETVTKIGTNAFQNCSGFRKLELGSGLTSLGSAAFSGCSGFEGEIVIPETITTIEGSTFSGCSSLTRITLHSGITSIGTFAFSNCSNWEGDLTVPPLLIQISEASFENCASLTSFNIPEKVTTIGKSAFKGCTGFNGVLQIPDNVTTLGDYCFRDCTGFTSIDFGTGISSMGVGVFYGCKGLQGLITFPENVTIINNYLFFRCSGIETIALNDKITKIGTHAFEDCISLSREMNLPSIKTIGDYGFYGCQKVTSFKFGENLTSIGQYALVCSGVKSIVSMATIPPTCQSNTFMNIDKTIPLYVPDGSVEDYKGAPYWESFENIASSPNFVTDIIIKMDGEAVDGTTQVELLSEFSLTATVMPENATIKTVKWSTDNTAALNLQRKEDNSVNITTVKPGTWTVTATAMDGSETSEMITVEVFYTPVEKVSINQSSATMHSKGTLQLNAKVTPEDASDKRINWTSDDETIASVNAFGYVTAKKSGSVTITATSRFDPEVSDECVITVIPYTLTYMVDNDVYRIQEYEPGEIINPVEAPEKTGYTFDKWNNLPTEMPEDDITVSAEYTVNSYTVTYMVDGEEYETLSYDYMTEVTPPDEPEKTGHKFTGWSGLPDKMPAENITVNATFDKLIYELIYMVDGEIYDTEHYEYGAELTPLEAPAKIGHTFGGWSEIPDKMPAENVTVTAIYSVNSYNVTFYIDGEIYKADRVNYGDIIPIPEIIVPDDRIFNGWETTIPVTMPPNDLEIYGTTSQKSSVTDIFGDRDAKYDVYNLSGVRVLQNVSKEEFEERLNGGIYIIVTNGKSQKIVIRK